MTSEAGAQAACEEALTDWVNDPSYDVEPFLASLRARGYTLTATSLASDRRAATIDEAALPLASDIGSVPLTPRMGLGRPTSRAAASPAPDRGLREALVDAIATATHLSKCIDPSKHPNTHPGGDESDRKEAGRMLDIFVAALAEGSREGR